MRAIDPEILTQTTCPLEMLEPSAADMLRSAADIVDGARNATHGNKRQNMQHTADMWSAYLGYPITAEQVAICMVLVKVSRTKCGTAIDDHYVDMAGYAAIAGEVR